MAYDTLQLEKESNWKSFLTPSTHSISICKYLSPVKVTGPRQYMSGWRNEAAALLPVAILTCTPLLLITASVHVKSG